MTENAKENKPLRSKEVVEQEYNQTAVLCGDKTFRKKLLEVEIDGLQQKMFELTKEHKQILETQVPIPAPQPVPAASQATA